MFVCARRYFMYPKPLFEIFGRGIYAYGICMAVGIIACFAFLMLTMKYKKFSEASADSILLIGIFGTGFGLLSGILFQGMYNLIDTGKFSMDGMTFIGGLIGGVVSFLAVWNIYMYVVRPRAKAKWLTAEMNATLTDALPFIPIGIAIAHAFGRLGCFFAGCCYGKEVPWGLHCSSATDIHGIRYTLDVNVMPTQLFEMSFLIVLAVAMAILYFKFKFNYNFAVYSIGYGIWRFIIEFFRDDERGKFIGNVTPSQFWSIVMVLVGIGYIFAQYYYFSKMMKHPEREPEPKEEISADESSNA